MQRRQEQELGRFTGGHPQASTQTNMVLAALRPGCHCPPCNPCMTTAVPALLVRIAHAVLLERTRQHDRRPDWAHVEVGRF
eukprot:CAMPEP_0202908632 /NCGR_PEP_ID=MMETSP1392-20130828/46704_1 /ASSEMBLY_ACC=CAM_ASM_000868 /TAXON_ID=225041 /ORGANISM="Chlamydomonas chlamydogama, Strain SAG 11-48b" /LENGTH=80 /DNA_ID=CAMNT_0049598057 /DNA_START=33 /DNA_END=275 /DNA_ORIENTATION=-